MTDPRFRLSVLAAALGEDMRRSPAVAMALGFSGLLFDAFTPALNIPDLSASGQREFRHLLSSRQQQLVGLRADLGPRGLLPGADVDQALRQLDRAMESSAGLAAPLVCVDLGPLPEPPEEPRPRTSISPEQAGLILLPESFTAAPAPETTPRAMSPALDPSFAAQVDGALSELGRLADRYSVTLAFRSDLSSLSAVERALRQANCPWFGVDFDPVAVLHDAWSMDEAFSRLGPLIRHVRARDAIGGAQRRTRPAVIGRGDIDWGALLADLDAGGYRGWITIDPMELTDRLAAARAGREYLLQAEGRRR